MPGQNGTAPGAPYVAPQPMGTNGAVAAPPVATVSAGAVPGASNVGPKPTVTGVSSPTYTIATAGGAKAGVAFAGVLAAGIALVA